MLIERYSCAYNLINAKICQSLLENFYNSIHTHICVCFNVKYIYYFLLFFSLVLASGCWNIWKNEYLKVANLPKKRFIASTCAMIEGTSHLQFKVSYRCAEIFWCGFYTYSSTAWHLLSFLPQVEQFLQSSTDSAWTRQGPCSILYLGFLRGNGRRFLSGYFGRPCVPSVT